MAQARGGDSPTNVSHHLKGVGFPASKQDLVEQARQNGADRDVIDSIERMPEDRYENMADVMRGYGATH